jgi:hypothetical protein
VFEYYAVYCCNDNETASHKDHHQCSKCEHILCDDCLRTSRFCSLSFCGSVCSFVCRMCLLLSPILFCLCLI